MGSINSKPPDEPEIAKQIPSNAQNIPSVYVNSELLNIFTPQSSHTVYEIDGKTYTDNLDRYDDFQEFELYAQRIGVTDKENETSPNTSNFEIQAVEDGFIVNSKLFLNIQHYHTLINIFEDCLNCFVCDGIVLVEEYDSHIESEDHRRNLESSPPLEEHQMNVVRMKNDHYHCATCNLVFHNKNTNHFVEQNHTNNEAFALKKAAEVIDERNRNNNTKNYNNNTKNYNNNDNDDTKNQNNDTQNNKNDVEIKFEIGGTNEYASLDSRVFVKTRKNTFFIPYLTWNMVTVDKNSRFKFYCMACKLIDSLEKLKPHINGCWHKHSLGLFKINYSYENHVIRQDTKWTHCGTCNTVFPLDGTDKHITTHDMGKTAVLTNTLSKENNSEINRNIKNNQQQEITPKQTNTKEIEINDSINTNNDLQSPSNSQKSNPKNVYNENRNNDIVKSLINEKCFVFLFGFRIQVSLLSLNVIFYDRMNFFYCGLCKVKILPQYIIDHMNTLLHNSLLNSIPAVPQYGYNYIRSVDNLPHCGICHMLLQPNMLLLHLQDLGHIMSANTALGLVNLPPPPPPSAFPLLPPPQVAKVTPNVKNCKENVKKDALNKINEANVINSNEIENEMKIENGTKIKTGNDESIIMKKSDVYIEVNESKIHEIEMKYGDDSNAGILEADIEVLKKKARLLISLTSFNALVPIGDGDRYCFACEVSVENDTLKKHISSNAHMEMIKDLKFLEEYGCNLIRQNSSLYHCSLCNTIVRQTDLKHHTEWITHEEQRNSKKNVKKKERNTTEYINKVFPTVKEVICSKKVVKDIVIRWSYNIKNDTENIDRLSPQKIKQEKNKSAEINVPKTKKEMDLRNKKTIIIDDFNLKLVLTWDAWHSIIRTKKKYLCVICNEKMTENDIDEHISSESHKFKLDKPFSMNFFPALIREVSSEMQHCATCNIVLYDKCNIQTHLQGNKHKRLVEDLINNSKNDNNEDIIIV